MSTCFILLGSKDVLPKGFELLEGDQLLCLDTFPEHLPEGAEWAFVLRPNEGFDSKAWQKYQASLTGLKPGIWGVICDYQDEIQVQPRLAHHTAYEQLKDPAWQKYLPILQGSLNLKITADQPAPSLSESEILARQAAEPDVLAWSFLLAVHYFEKQDDAKAYKIFRALIKNPHTASCYVYLSKLYHLKLLWEMKQFDKTVEALNLYFDEQPELEFLPALWVLRGVLSKYFGENQVARECFLKVAEVREHPEFYKYNLIVKKADLTWKPLVGLGEIYLEDNLFTQAFHAFKEALEAGAEYAYIKTQMIKAGFFVQQYEAIQPHLKTPGLGLSPSVLSAISLLGGEGSDDLSCSELAQSLLGEFNIETPEPFLLSVLVEFSVWLLQKNELDAAQKTLQKLVRIIPQEVLLWHNLAYTFFAQKDYSKALQFYQNALTVNPHFAASQFDSAKIHVMLGDEWQAVQTLKQLLKMHPDHIEAKQALTQLEVQLESTFLPPTTEYVENPAVLSEADQMPFIFLFPLAPTWENGADLVLKAYFEAFVPEDQVVLAFPVAEENELIQSALRWAGEKYSADQLAPLVLLPEALPLVPQKSALVFPHRIQFKEAATTAFYNLPSFKNEFHNLPYPVITNDYPLIGGQVLPVSLVAAESEQPESDSDQGSVRHRVWEEADLHVLKQWMRLAKVNQLPVVVSEEPVGYSTHHWLDLAESGQAEQVDRSVKIVSPDLPSARVSVCMIVKDEERFLKDCLDSIPDSVFEIIIVDTGSQDQTKMIASQDDRVKLFDFEWQDDFALARNFAVSQATGDWVLGVDADETLSEHFMSTLSHYLSQDLSAYDACVFPVIAIDTQGQELPDQTLPVPRLFRNDGNYVYVGRVHEMIKHNTRAKMNYLYLAQVPIWHKGYQPEVKAERQKWQRDADLMEAMLAESPESPETERLYLVLAGLNQEKGEIDEALAYLEKGLKHVTTDLRLRQSLSETYCQLLLQLDRPEEVISALETHPEKEGVNHAFLLGTALLSLGQTFEAAQTWEKALQGMNIMSLSGDPLGLQIKEELLLEHLTQAYYQLGESAQTVYYLKRLLKLVPDHSRAASLYEEFVQKQNL